MGYSGTWNPSLKPLLLLPLTLFQGKEHWPMWLKTWVHVPETVGCEISDA